MALSQHSRLLAFLLAATSPILSLGDELDPVFGASVPVVLTPTRLRQSLPDVPASVSIITSEMIHNYGIRSIPDALRLVPGMAITQITGNDYRINYHGGNILVPRRMNVLLDGMSVYGSRVSRVDWRQLPLPIEDIERIEVIRGPNSASYGSNSLLAIVNIITKHPHEATGTTAGATAGSLHTNRTIIRHGGDVGTATSYRASLEREGDSGFDYASSTGVGHDSHSFARFNFRSLTELAAFETLNLQASLSQGTAEAEYVDSSQRSFPDVKLKDYSFGLIWKKNPSEGHEIQLKTYATGSDNKQEWKSCLPAAYLLAEVAALGRSNPAYVRPVLAGRTPTGGTPSDDVLASEALAAIAALGEAKSSLICGETNQNFVQRRYDMELQDTYVFSPSLRAVNGIGVRHNEVDSETYFSGRVSNQIWRAFSNVEYKPFRYLTVNAGGFLERDNLTGDSFSPRVAVNGHLDNNNTVRFVLAKATRMPDFVEQRSDWTYHLVNYQTPLNGATDGYFAFSAISPGNLKGEKILSKEIGYFGNFPRFGILVDAKIFEDRFTDLISEKLQNSDFKPSNRNWARSRGVEVQVSCAPTDNLSVLLGYTNLHSVASNTFEQTQSARHSGFIGLSYLSDDKWQYSFAVYQYGGNTNGQTFYGQQDLTLFKRFKLGSLTVTPLFTVTHLDNKSSKFLVDVGRVRESRYNDSMKYFGSVEVAF